MDTDASSAEPSALFAYAGSGLSIDAQLEATSSRLAAALDEFAATCREYSLGINSGLAQQLRAYARRTSETDLWVRRVGEQFALADQGQATDTLIMGTLESATSVADWNAASKIEAALERAIAKLPSALAEQLRALRAPENVAALVLVLDIWAASHAFGVGEVVDLILAVGGVIMLGPDAIRAVQELAGFAIGVGAQSDADLDRAGEHLATAVAIVGVDGAMALLAHRAGKLGGEVPKIEPSGPQLVTPEGVRIKPGVTTETIDAQPSAMSARPNVDEAQTLTGGPGRVDADGVVLADGTIRASAEQVRVWADGLDYIDTPANSARDLYEITTTGDRNYAVPAGDETIMADGVRAADAHLLEAKYVDNPARSPFIDGSACPDFVRDDIRAKVDDEFRREAREWLTTSFYPKRRQTRTSTPANLRTPSLDDGQERLTSSSPKARVHMVCGGRYRWGTAGLTVH